MADSSFEVTAEEFSRIWDSIPAGAPPPPPQDDNSNSSSPRVLPSLKGLQTILSTPGSKKKRRPARRPSWKRPGVVDENMPVDHHHTLNEEDLDMNSNSSPQNNVDCLSLAGLTVASEDTVKVSNRNLKIHNTRRQYQPNKEGGSLDPLSKLDFPLEKKRSGGWIRKIMGRNQQDAGGTSPLGRVRSRTNTQELEDLQVVMDLQRNRVRSEDYRKEPKEYSNSGGAAGSGSGRKRLFSAEELRSKSQGSVVLVGEGPSLDDAIKGRMDGVDCLHLGTGYPSSLCSKLKIDPGWYPASYTSQELVQQMMLTSSGHSLPEITLEGLSTSGDGRWVVRIEQRISDSDIPQLERIDDSDDASTSTSSALPTHLLNERIWGQGNKPPPSHAALEPGNDVMALAASAYVPIDVDEQSFMIESTGHILSIHNIAATLLKNGQFDKALDLFERILQSLRSQKDATKRHFIGATLHNIGTLHLWMGNFDKAEKTLQDAVAVRTECLPPRHPDIAVSLSKEALALFARERYDSALTSLERALTTFTKDNATRAKILNNMGVMHFQGGGDAKESLKCFTSALEIQRLCLQGPWKRDYVVFEAAVTLSNMGKAYLEREKFDLAACVYEECVMLQTTILRKNHELVLKSLGSLAFSRAKNGDLKKGIKVFYGILRSQINANGEDSVEALETMRMLGVLHMRAYEKEDAVNCLTRVLAWQKQSLDPSHPAIRNTRVLIKLTQESLKDDARMWI